MELSLIPESKRLPSVGIQERGNSLQINLPRVLFSDHKQRRIMSGLPNTEEGRARCEKIVASMNIDILHSVFDYSLIRYDLPKLGNKFNHLRLIEFNKSDKKKEEISLAVLWGKYAEYRKSGLAETTYINTWERIYTRMINRIPDKCKDALGVRQFIVGQTTPIYQHRILAVISKCYEWGMKHKLVGDNPYRGMAEEIKPKRTKQHTPKSVASLGLEMGDDDFKAFTASEMNAIIEAFESGSHRQHWVGFVKFLFWTGCRPGEALALRWKHISPDYRVITFDDTFGMIQNSTRSYIAKGTKTGKVRKFRLNEGGKLYELLRSMKSEDASPDDLVFQSPRGGVAKWKQFTRTWHGYIDERPSGERRNVGVIPALIQEGKVQQYLKPYSTRHTFITLQLEAGANIADIARQVGNSPNVIMAHYASGTRDLALPEI